MLNLTSLREQVYLYLREQMHNGKLLPGSTIDLNEISKQLGISRTPLRDALIRLECEGFVQILPRRGVRVAALTLQDVKELYEIIGTLEGGVIETHFDHLDAECISRMEDLNQRMREAMKKEDFNSYYELNLDFHNVFLDLSDNVKLRELLDSLKRRLYDFPRRSYIKDWELQNCDEHDQFIGRIKAGDCKGAVRIMRDVHWSYEAQERHIKRFYYKVVEHIRAERELANNH